MKMFCMFITLVSYFISVRQVYDTFIVHTLTEDVKVKRSSQMDIRIGNFFSATYCKISLSSQLSSVALIAHPTPEQPHYPTALKSQPVRRVLPAAGASSGASQESAPLLQSQPEPMHTPRLVIQGGRVGWLSRLGVQVGRFRVAARGLDEASALRWMPGWKG